MPPAAPEPPAKDPVREAAASWFARMRGPDAERHRAAFEAWAATPAHRAAYDRMALRWEQSGLVGHTPSGQARTGLPAVKPRPPILVYAIAAAIAGLILTGLLLATTRVPGERAGTQPLAARALSTPIGTIRRVTLPDGSVVILDTASRIELAFTPSERRVRLLAGRARFEVAHGAARPFIVAAGTGEVVATGTMFDVSLIGARPQVRLIQGSVAIRRIEAGAPRLVIAKLVPGQAASLGEPDARPQALPADRWVGGMLSYDNVPLAEVLAEANRYARQPITLADLELGKLRVTGGFKAGDQRAIADALAAGLGLKVEHGADGGLRLARRGA